MHTFNCSCAEKFLGAGIGDLEKKEENITFSIELQFPRMTLEQTDFGSFLLHQTFQTNSFMTFLEMMYNNACANGDNKTPLTVFTKT